MVSLAKHHNYYGHMDTYMKQFCNVIVQNGDRQAVKTLERVMNAEVSIRNPKTTELLNEYKDKKHEIDANVLAQPAF